MAYNSKTGLVYIPARETGSIYGQLKEWEFQDDSRSWNTGQGYNNENETREDTIAKKNFGKLIAWDPINQKEVWNVKQVSNWNAGVLTTDELVFQGNAEGEFSAYDALTGEKVWSYTLETGIIASPVTYEVDGVQYVSILVGWGGIFGIFSKFTDQINPGTLYTFALGKNEPMPEFPNAPEKELVDLESDGTIGQIQNGRRLFDRYCSKCHGGGIIPDLTYSRPEIFDSFQQIVGEGILLGLGMPNFGDRLNESEISDIRNYILSQAKSRREKEKR
jgi:quinohemoprotein ethanol dehydrogenase